MKKRKKIFLGGYINNINAQNINCKSIALNLDKKKYNVKVLVLSPFNNLEKIVGVKVIKVFNLFYKLSNFFAFLIGVFWANVAYVPKHHSTPKLVLKLSRYFGTKIFTTIEGNMCDISRRNMINSFGSIEKMKKYFCLIPNIYGISSNIISSSVCGIILHKNPLFLGVEKDIFLHEKTIDVLKNIVFIGSLVKTKRIEEFLELAKYFPQMRFNVVGSGAYLEELKESSTENIIFHGELNHSDMSTLLYNMDLHFLPSRSEGFPKVILETASASIPSLIYNTYGASEWINNNENGFLISDFNQAIDVINNLIREPELLKRTSHNALELANKFDWKLRIKDWEKVIDNLK